MEFKLIASNDKEWKDTIEYAKNCTSKIGFSLAKKMINHYFNDWQRVMIVKDNHQIIAFCIFTKEDSITNVNYMPYIGFVFVDKKYGFDVCDYKENRQGIIEKIYGKEI